MTREEFLDLLARLRCAPVGRARLRAPHKPLLLLWLFGRFAVYWQHCGGVRGG